MKGWRRRRRRRIRGWWRRKGYEEVHASVEYHKTEQPSKAPSLTSAHHRKPEKIHTDCRPAHDSSAQCYMCMYKYKQDRQANT